MNVAVIGASNQHEKFGNKAVRSYLAHGHSVYPVNLREKSIEGLAVYRSILDVPVDLDATLVYVPPEVTIRLLPAIAKKGPGALYFNPGSEDDAVVAFIDWAQGGAGGFARLPETTQAGLRDNARTLGPTIAGAQPDVSPASLRGVRVPTLVVNGAQTRPYYRLIGEVTTASILGARLSRLADCGHMAIVENPAATAALIEQFLPA